MNVYRISRKPKDVDYFEDYAIVVIAEDRRHAERRARWSSGDFRKAKKSRNNRDRPKPRTGSSNCECVRLRRK